MLRTLRWGDYPGLSMWAQFNFMSPYKQQREAEEWVGEIGWKKKKEIQSVKGI